jgi:hypothetical protein
MEHEILQALLYCIEKHPKGDENKEWFTKLIQNSLNGNADLEIDADLIYNATVIESILASILSVDIKTIVKVRLVHKIICTLWEENNWDTNTLTSYILENKPTVINPQPIPSDNNNNNNNITD